MRHPTLGAIRFTPWDWQSSLFSLWQVGKSTITNKSRQVGWSWCAVAYVNWLLNFHPEMTVLLLSEKEEKAMKLLDKLTFFYEHIPDWMQSRSVSKTKTQLVLSMRYYDEGNGRWVHGNGVASSLTTTGTSGAGESARAVIIDEFALMSERGHDADVWAAIAPTTTHGGQLIVGSTPRGSAGEFYRIWMSRLEWLVDNGIIDESADDYRQWNIDVLKHAHGFDMIPFAVHYSMCYHDEGWVERAVRGLSDSKANKIREHFSKIRYDSIWRDKQARRMGLSDDQVLQEYELHFDSFGNVAFSTEDINACYCHPNKNPWVKRLMNNSEYFYIGVDTAEGITAKNKDPDYNSIQVLNQSGVQVYAEHNRENLDDWAGTTMVDPLTGREVPKKGTVLKVIEKYSPCTVIIEKNGPGMAVLTAIQNLLPDDVEVLPLSMAGGIKSQLVSDMKIEMADEQVVGMQDNKLLTARKVILTDYTTILSMRQFVKVGPGKFEASHGSYDDAVIALLWAVYAKRIRGAYDGVAVLPQGRDVNRPVGESVEDDILPQELPAMSEGPVAVTADQLQDIAGARYDDLWGRGLTGTSRGLRGGARGFGGRGR